MEPVFKAPALPEMAERIYFADAMTELGIKEEELRSLVSAGEIRAWRDPAQDGSMFLRIRDVRELKAQL